MTKLRVLLDNEDVRKYLEGLAPPPQDGSSQLVYSYPGKHWTILNESILKK